MLPHALILAATVGRRLGGAQDRRPKTLLDLGGRSLLARRIANLRAVGIERVAVVTGYGADRVRAEAGADPNVRLLLNPDCREGSVVSLWTGQEVLRAGWPVILMDATCCATVA